MATAHLKYWLPLAIALGALPTEARAQCEQWQLGKSIDIIQGQYNIRLSFVKNRDNQFTGTAAYYFNNVES